MEKGRKDKRRRNIWTIKYRKEKCQIENIEREKYRKLIV
jgi:hypothetical protein